MIRLALLALAIALAAAVPASAIVKLPLVPRRRRQPRGPDRMGVEEIIWDCGHWGAGMTEFVPYCPCFDKRGKRRLKVNPTVAHRDHLHLGMPRSGAGARTSFWSAGR